MEIVTRPHVNNFIDFSVDKPRLLVLSADLTNSCEVGRWRDTYPDRFISVGMAEQNMMGVAAGLAREGFEPWIHTFAVFIYRRPYDQLAMSIAYPNLPVRFVGFLPGIATPGGVTHQAIEDIAIMRATPNMTVLETGDATEVESVLEVAHRIDGPVYIRMLRGALPRLFPRDEPMELGRARLLREGHHATVLTAGIATESAMRAGSALAEQGVEITHVHVSTHKPFGDEVIEAALHHGQGPVVTLENHSIVGGLGSAVSEYVADRGIGRKVVRLGLRDTYSHGASTSYLLRECGLDAAALVRAIEGELGVALGIDAATLDGTEIGVSGVNAESL